MCLTIFILPQLMSAQITTKGKDFWLGFTENEFVQGLALEIYITSENRATVNLSNPLGTFRNTKIVEPGTSSLVILPGELMPREEGLNNFGIHITSDSDISIYALNKLSLSVDATMVLPTEALDTEYYVMAHVKQDTLENDARESNMLIVATEDDTEIEVVPSVDTFRGWSAGETQTIILHAGQTYQVKSNSDLTGTFVRSVVGPDRNCKKIAVFGGNRSTNVGDCGASKDHLMEQMTPVSSWGEEFLFVPYQSRVGGDLVKVMASVDGTKVQISGIGTIELDAGEYYTNESLDGVRSISSDKPISIGQFSRSQGCDGNPSDPFMILLSPIDQGIKSITFSALPTLSALVHHLTLVTSRDNLNGILLDGVDITDQFTIIGDAAYATVTFGPGDHSLVANESVIPYVYAYGNEESFGYVAGMSLGNEDLALVAQSLEIEGESDANCVDSPVELSANFVVPAGTEPLFDTFEWDFGDGNTGFGETTNHVYDTPGEYEVVLVASNGRSKCNNTATMMKKIRVRPVAVADFIGPLSVCPDVMGIEYEVEGPVGNTYEWFIRGGVITNGGTGRKITVNWGGERDDAFIKVLPKNTDQCNVDTLTFEVRINEALTPARPGSNGFSNHEVCFDAFQSVEYAIPQTNGSMYEWFVDSHGAIIGSNLGSEITVSWNGPGQGQVWYREYNPSIPNCEGISEPLDVTIYSEINAVPSIVNVGCSGEASGAIHLNITGGKPGAYQVDWSNGMSGTEVTDLRAGSYTAIITDALGCSVERTYIVEEPEPLRVMDIEVAQARCFGEASGKVMVLVDGGTRFSSGDYHYTWRVGDDIVQTTNTGEANGIPGGTYQLVVKDANDCEAQVDFTIDQPTALEANLEKLINEPICPQASNGTAFIDAKGGTPDYQFFWSNRPDENNKAATDLSKGDYSVRIVDANGCDTVFNLTVSERFPRLSVPTAFSPNGDGINDVFLPVTDCALVFTMQVYNQWGSIIFSTKDLASGWDGTFEGQLAPDGKYSYVVFYSGVINDVTFEETFRGTVKLIR